MNSNYQKTREFIQYFIFHYWNQSTSVLLFKKISLSFKKKIEIEKILNKRNQKYLIKWKNYFEKNNTWKLYKNLKNCQKLTKFFQKIRKKKTRKNIRIKNVIQKKAIKTISVWFKIFKNFKRFNFFTSLKFLSNIFCSQFLKIFFIDENV